MYVRLGSAVSSTANILRATYIPKNRYELILNSLLLVTSFLAMQPVLNQNMETFLAPVFLASSVAIVAFLYTTALFTALIIAAVLVYNVTSDLNDAFELERLSGLLRSWCAMLTFTMLGLLCAMIRHPI